MNMPQPGPFFCAGIYSFSTFFYLKLINDGYSSVQQCLNTEDIYNLGCIWKSNNICCESWTGFPNYWIIFCSSQHYSLFQSLDLTVYASAKKIMRTKLITCYSDEFKTVERSQMIMKMIFIKTKVSDLFNVCQCHTIYATFVSWQCMD